MSPKRGLARYRLQALTLFPPYLLIALARDHGHILLGDKESQAQIPRLVIGTGLFAALALRAWTDLDMTDMPTADGLTADLAAAALYVTIRKRIENDPGVHSGRILAGVEMTMMLHGLGKLFLSL
jgi:hypothetical protein